MKAIKFEQMNCTYAEDQPEYEPLPAYKMEDGTVLSCWKMSWKERLHVLFSGKIWLWLWSGNGPLTPSLLQVNSPFVGKCE